MKNEPSGAFEFDTSLTSDRILIHRLYGQWNIQMSHKAIDLFLHIAKENFPNHKWGGVSDLRNWGLCSPDVVEHFNNSIPDFMDSRCRWHAIITNNSIKKMVAKQHIEASGNKLTMQYFNDDAGAIHWLKTKLNEDKSI
ncbi:hypothetical protein L4C34_19950 [Vibrio profundum]|uniref:hypothetical protein n=1 Tax=Vibrio profundum TaxID=2910247 RepID=UPI003D0D6073